MLKLKQPSVVLTELLGELIEGFEFYNQRNDSRPGLLLHALHTGILDRLHTHTHTLLLLFFPARFSAFSRWLWPNQLLPVSLFDRERLFAAVIALWWTALATSCWRRLHLRLSEWKARSHWNICSCFLSDRWQHSLAHERRNIFLNHYLKLLRGFLCVVFIPFTF